MIITVLFVCLGNICRSPMAEGIFQQMVNEAGLSDKIVADSVGTGSWHVGDQAHPGTRAILQEKGIPYNGRSRQIALSDLKTPNSYIIGMDQNNLNDVQRTFGKHPQHHRLLDFAANTKESNVPDPYYTDNFEIVYQLVADGCHGLLNHIRKQENI